MDRHPLDDLMARSRRHPRAYGWAHALLAWALVVGIAACVAGSTWLAVAVTR